MEKAKKIHNQTYNFLVVGHLLYTNGPQPPRFAAVMHLNFQQVHHRTRRDRLAGAVRGRPLLLRTPKVPRLNHLPDGRGDQLHQPVHPRVRLGGMGGEYQSTPS